MHRSQAGLTLIELLIVIAIIGVLLGFGLPSYQGFIEAGRASAAKSALLSSLTATSTRAAVTGRHAILCASTDGQACSGDLDWSAGWLGFVDRNGNRSLDADESVLLRQPALGGKVRLHSTRGRTRIVFQPNGGNAGSNATFTLCDGRGPERAETLVISNAGRMRYGTPSRKTAAATCASD